MNPQDAPKIYFELVHHGTLLNELDVTFDRLADPALRAEAVARLKRGIVDLAKKVVDELSRPKPTTPAAKPVEEPFREFVVDRGAVSVNRGLDLFEDTLEDYLDWLESAL